MEDGITMKYFPIKHYVIDKSIDTDPFDFISEWLISNTTSRIPDLHGSTNVAVIWISKSDPVNTRYL